MEPRSQNRRSSSLERSLDVLEALASADSALSLTHLVDRLQMPKATVYRLLTTLVERGYAGRGTGDDGGYSLGLRCLELGSAVTKFGDLRASAAHALNAVNRLSGELVILAVYDGGFAVYVDTRKSTNPVCCASYVGFRAPAVCVSTGRALLAFQAKAEIDRVLTEPVPRYAPKTIVTPSELRQLLEGVRRDGAAVNYGSYRDGVGGVSAPIRDRTGSVVASIGFCLPEYRMDGLRIKWLKREILQAAGHVSTRLGYGVAVAVPNAVSTEPA